MDVFVCVYIEGKKPAQNEVWYIRRGDGITVYTIVSRMILIYFTMKCCSVATLGYDILPYFFT